MNSSSQNFIDAIFKRSQITVLLNAIKRDGTRAKYSFSIRAFNEVQRNGYVSENKALANSEETFMTNFIISRAA